MSDLVRLIGVPLDEAGPEQRNQTSDEDRRLPETLGEEHRLLECRLGHRRGVTVERVRRRRHGLEDLKFPGVPIATLGLSVDELETSSIEPDGLGVGEQRSRCLGGLLQVDEGPVGPAAPVVLLGERRCHCVQVVGVDHFESLSTLRCKSQRRAGDTTPYTASRMRSWEKS